MHDSVGGFMVVGWCEFWIYVWCDCVTLCTVVVCCLGLFDVVLIVLFYVFVRH